MKYAKLIDGYPSYAPNPILHDGNYIGNPPGEVYEAEGYKAVRYTDPPVVAEGFVAVPGWEEQDEEIVQVWTVELAPVSEEEALVRYANELTGADDETLEAATERLIKMNMEER